MHDLPDLWKYLKHNPPLHEIIGDYFGVRSDGETEKNRPGTRAELEQIANQWRGPGG